MDKSKQTDLRKRGWRVGNAAEFLGLTNGEAAFVELKASLAFHLRRRRQDSELTQKQFAILIRSSQSRVAKMESHDPAVSLDLLVRSLLALGASRREIGRIIGAPRKVCQRTGGRPVNRARARPKTSID